MKPVMIETGYSVFGQYFDFVFNFHRKTITLLKTQVLSQYLIKKCFDRIHFLCSFRVILHVMLFEYCIINL